jgi:hydroxymethylpyrimidine pyrophosphatase-like HAD family hydrolase
MNKKHLSNLRKTWIFDLDGTLVEHNGYKINKEIILSGVKEFFDSHIKDDDYVMITTGRNDEQAAPAIELLKLNNIKIDKIITNLPLGERLLFNDIKPDTKLKTAYSFNLDRDMGLEKIKFTFNK